MSQYVNVADVGQLPTDRGLNVRVAELEFALFNVGGVLCALDGRCPHRGGPLGDGWMENGHVYCPLHGWEFDVQTGACINNADRPVKTYPVRVQNGKVQIWI